MGWGKDQKSEDFNFVGNPFEIGCYDGNCPQLATRYTLATGDDPSSIRIRGIGTQGYRARGYRT